MPASDPVIYIKQSLKSFWNGSGWKNGFSFFRDYPSWQQHLKPGRNPVDDQTPWINFSAIRYLSGMAESGMHVFEYGSGGSTLFWSSRVKELVSVEHDPSWYATMKTRLEQNPLGRVRYLLAEPVPDPEFQKKRFDNPDDFISADPSYTGKNFEQYVKSIDPFPDQYFDIIVVDGRARPSCIQHAIPKLKKNGWLVVDNSDRKYYLAPFRFDRKSWKTSKFAGPVPYMRGFSETSFLKKLT